MTSDNLNKVELETFARAWIKYISVATLQGENALTRKGVQDAITGYKDVQDDFTQALTTLQEAQIKKVQDVWRRHVQNLNKRIEALEASINNEKIALLTEVYVPIGENDSNALLDQKALRTHIKVFQKLATLKKGVAQANIPRADGGGGGGMASVEEKSTRYGVKPPKPLKKGSE